jgi:amphi-Trp domain-containing protein
MLFFSLLEGCEEQPMVKDRRTEMEKTKVSFRQAMESQDAVKLLGGLVESLKAGKIVVEQGEEFISMDPAGKVDVEIEAKQKKDKGELSIELSWKLAEAEEAKDPLKISSKEPEPAEKDVAEENAGKGPAEHKKRTPGKK